MSFSSSDAARVLRFCLVADDAGTVEEREDGACVITIVTARPTYQVHTFEETSFESALRAAAAGGALRAACVEKQIAFTTRHDLLADASAARPRRAAESKASDPAASVFLLLTDAVGALLHETQRERGVSTMFVGSAGHLVGDELTAQWKRTDQQKAILFDIVGSELGGLPAAVQRRFQHASSLVGAIDGTRDAVMGGRALATRVIEVYTALNAALLAAIEAFMVTGVVGAWRSDALACIVLLHAKEKVGIERAQLSVAFLRDRFEHGQRLSVASLIAAQSTYLHIFSATAPAVGEEALRHALTSPVAAEVQRMESVVFMDGEGGFGIDARTWFRTVSRKIDMLGDVSTAVLGSLRSHG